MSPFDQTTAAFAVGLTSAAGFATANALQHRAAGQVPVSVERALAVLGSLARQPIWLVATGISFCAMLLHAVALQLGSLALVQPLMLVGVVLAVPLRAAIEHKRPTASELHAVGVTAAGLALFVASTNPSPASSTPAAMVLTSFIGASLALTVLAVRASRRARDPKRQAARLAAAAGLMFGVTAGLLKTVGNVVGTGNVAASAAAVACLIGVGVTGVALNQRAYQVAPLAFSMPVVNVVDIIAAVVFGVVAYGEQPAHSIPLLLLQTAGLGITAIGLSRISSLEPSSLPTGRAAVREAWS